MIKLIYFSIVFLFCSTCSTGPIFETLKPSDLLIAEDSLRAIYPNSAEFNLSVINARLTIVKLDKDFDHYNKILEIDPKNPTANYHISMRKGKGFQNKDYKNGQWDAIQAFSKAATYIDTLGAPFYWIAKSYEKKDDQDFELPLEAYNKSLTLYLSKELEIEVKKARASLLKRKKVYKDFWK